MPALASIRRMQKFIHIFSFILFALIAIPAGAAPADDAVTRGREALKTMDMAGAMSAFDAALKIDPAHADAAYERGLLFMRMGKPNEAIADFTTAVVSNPAHGRAFAHRGEVKITVNNWDSAFEDFDMAVEVAPKDYQVLVIRASYLLAKDKAKARADMDAAVAVADPHAAEVLTRMRKEMGLEQ